VDERQERLGRNEALYREVNERLKELGESFSMVAEVADFVCECGVSTCAGPIRMTLEEYEHVRSNPHWFTVLPGHEIRDIESVVERHEGWTLIEKHPGGPADLAAQSDPRTS
jgi:hypothetical protein